ncbi:beta-ketoadipate enol-lactone hydrolase [Lentinula raphanica]|uniref:Beta-ketoadipate enol-lactone hydrolase n=1 Tax=Lentinula raphanica TaxID=153919 RepID=A0AA38UJZ6_9AGAR|nr:beta-ketoadipate enol-lactone hydrolase [Lentinula raphanica]
MPTSRLVPGRYPAAGTSTIADKIRERRGARGLTPLDGTLLHVPPVAEGWNSLLGAVRTKGRLNADVRELMILRVAAINNAAFEWIHHEHVARDAGLTTEQLYLIRDTSSLPPSGNGLLSPLQTAALAFAHHSTSTVKVPPEVTLTLAEALRSSISSEAHDAESLTQDLLVESAAIVASYNMVSRFLVSLDVAAMADCPPPWPATKSTFKVPLPVDPANGVLEEGHFLYAETHVTDPDAPWIVCANSLLTDVGMWEWALTQMLAPRPHGSKEVETLGKEGVLPDGLFLGKYKTFNVLLHDQRGHGQSSIPSSLNKDGLQCTIPILASDIAFLISTLILPSSSSVRSTIDSEPRVHSVIGVSQGGAAALAFAAMYPSLSKSVVSCDTGPRTPEGNKVAWNERIELVKSNGGGQAGMSKLADITVPRWFPAPSRCSTEMYPPGQVLSSPHTSTEISSINGRRPRSEALHAQITSTTLDGFVLGASALQDYNLLTGIGMNRSLLDATNSSEPKVLLVAGGLDGGGKVPSGMGKLRDAWNEKRISDGGDPIKLEVIEGAGHLPMVDETEKWWCVVGAWLAEI